MARHHIDRRLVESTRHNINKVMTNLRRKGADMVTAAKDALKEGVDQIVVDAKTRVPVKTGRLRDSIRAETLNEGAIYKLTADAKNGDNVSYAQYVEYDPRIAKPFLYPAIDANVSNLHAKIKHALQAAL